MADGEDAEGNLAAGAGVPEGQHPESGPADPVSEKSSFWRRVGRIAKWTGIGTAVLAALGALTVFFVIRHYEAGLPSVEQLKKGYDPPQVTRILARDGTLLANLFTERRTVIPLSEVPDHVKLAFLAAEDASFYEHAGLNYLGMLRALVANLRAGHTTQGGSTITQQVVKNLLLDPERTYSRKIKETILARRMEQDLTKDEIFNLYLNHIYLGHGRYGIEEAARYYFGKKAKELDLAEGALLAGLVASPEHWSPRRAPDKAMARRRYVLGQMLEKGFVTRQLYEQAMKEPLRLAPAVEAESELAPEIVDYVKGILEQVGGKRARHGGYKVTTTIDPTLQAEARKAVRDNLERYAERQKLEPPFTLEKRRLWGRPFQGTPKKNHIYVGTVKALDDDHHTIDVQVGDTLGRVKLDKEERYDPRHLPPSKFAAEGASLRVSLLADPAPDDSSPVPLRLELGPESALVAIDVRTRQVRALIGSYEALMGGLDRATQSRRQPGSAFKPFVYSYALHSRRFTPATVLELPARHGKPGETRHISVRMALAKSDNAAAQYIFRQVGPANVVQWAHALGIESKLQPDVSLALGAYEVKPIEIAAAYRSFASGGTYAPPVLITRIIGPDGKLVALPKEPPPRRVMSAAEAYLTTSLMRSVVQVGTARRASSMGRPLAGKTGTTNDAKDAWFVGFSTDIVTSVWVGYDDANPLGWGEEGAVTALPGWMQFMKAAEKGRPPTEFARPGDIVVARIDPATGELAYEGEQDAVEEEFLDGTVPTEMASPDAGADGEADAGTEAGSGARVNPPEADAGQPVDAGSVRQVAAEAGSVDEPPPF
jgi:penicillin-binding protein 1A